MFSTHLIKCVSEPYQKVKFGILYVLGWLFIWGQKRDPLDLRKRVSATVEAFFHHMKQRGERTMQGIPFELSIVCLSCIWQMPSQCYNLLAYTRNKAYFIIIAYQQPIRSAKDICHIALNRIPIPPVNWHLLCPYLVLYIATKVNCLQLPVIDTCANDELAQMTVLLQVLPDLAFRSRCKHNAIITKDWVQWRKSPNHVSPSSPKKNHWWSLLCRCSSSGWCLWG